MANNSTGTDPCELCGSTRFKWVDGQYYCGNGHRQEDDPQIADNADEYGMHGQRTVAKKDKTKAKSSRVYRGSKAYKLFLQAYQLIIWKQCHALIHRKHLPPELWTVVKDLWTLRLARQADKLERSSPLDTQSQSQSAGAQSGGESANDNQTTLGSSRTKADDSPMLVETIALCCLGIMFLRLPTGLADIYRWVKTEDIPYFRAIRHIPPEMKSHLPGEYQWALDTEALLSPDALQIAVFRLCALYTNVFGMSLPAINSSLLLFQYIRQLALPLEIYPAVKNLNKIVKFTFTYTSTPSSRTRRNATSLPEAQLMSLVIIATKMIFPFDSAIVKRYPRSLNEPAAQRIDWKKWVEFRGQGTASVGANEGNVDAGEMRTRLHIEKGREAEITDKDILEMSGAELDQYMDWYQRTWIKSNDDTDDNVHRELRDMFPLKPLPAQDYPENWDRELEESQLTRVREVHAAMKLNRAVSDEDARQLQLDSQTPLLINRPGSHYRKYRNAEDMSEPARAFYEAAAEAACLSMERLVWAVLVTETRIAAWRRERRRAERFGENEGGDQDVDDDDEKGEEEEEEQKKGDIDEGENDGDEDMEMLGGTTVRADAGAMLPPDIDI